VGATARLDGLQAAVLRVKLRRLDAWNLQRRVAAADLREALAGLPIEPLRPPATGDHVYHLFVVRCAHRDLLRAHLTAAGIASAVHYPVAIHRTEAYAHLGLPAGSLPVAENLADEVCSLPLFPGMTEAQVDTIARVVAEAARLIGGHPAPAGLREEAAR
jgi:dTDP-4-amino-4,6-dideoxygalactose transaminase